MTHKEAIILLMCAVAETDSTGFSGAESYHAASLTGLYVDMSYIGKLDDAMREYISGIKKTGYTATAKTLLGYIPASMHMGVLTMLLEIAYTDNNGDDNKWFLMNCIRNEMQVEDNVYEYLKRIVESHRAISGKETTHYKNQSLLNRKSEEVL